jgi:hypothetical protein|tara:strand:+ start:161 stop:583 length:423 start_codon:yes stop_codon:yes gene_type:complete
VAEQEQDFSRETTAMKTNTIGRFCRHAALAAVVAGTAALAPPLQAQQPIDESPSEAEMIGDLLVARPIGAVMTVAGTAAFLVSLPFTVLAGNVSEAAETLMVGPAKTTFVRCLGCRKPGYSYKDIEANRARKAAEAEAEY